MIKWHRLFSPNTRNLELCSIGIGVFGAILLVWHSDADLAAVHYYEIPVFERFELILHRNTWATAILLQSIGHLVSIYAGRPLQWARIVFCISSFGFWLTLMSLLWGVPFFDAICCGMTLSTFWTAIAQTLIERVE